jgi:hypothetical protein
MPAGAGTTLRGNLGRPPSFRRLLTGALHETVPFLVERQDERRRGIAMRLAKAWKRQVQVASLVAVVLTLIGHLRDWGSEVYFVALSSTVAAFIQVVLSRILVNFRRG